VVPADDDHSVRAGHPAEARHRCGAVPALELGQDFGDLHPTMIAGRRPPGKCRAAQKRFSLVLVRTSAYRYQYPREKKPSSASTRTTIRMIQRMLMFEPPFGLVVGRLRRR
jgi:hypothetical protein